MKEGIHPKYHLITVKCACGNTFATHSTKPAISLEICGACHPFYTGKQRFVDTEGRIDRFLKKFGQAKVHKEVVAKKTKEKKVALAKTKTAAKAAKPETKKPKVLSTKPRG